MAQRNAFNFVIRRLHKNLHMIKSKRLNQFGGLCKIVFYI